MPSLLARGQSLLNRVMDESASETVRVIRGATVLCEGWLATPGTTNLETAIEGQGVVIGQRFDWSGDPDALRMDGATAKPQRGDTVEWTHGASTYVFEALPADGDEVWAPSGRFQNRIRIHTKLIDKRPLV